MIFLKGNQIKIGSRRVTFKFEVDAEFLFSYINRLEEDKDYYQTKAGKLEEELLYLRAENKKLKKDADSST